MLLADGVAEVPVACECGWDDGGSLVLVDLWRREYPPIPYVRIVRVDGDSAEGRGLSVCPRCGECLDEDTVIATHDDEGHVRTMRTWSDAVIRGLLARAGGPCLAAARAEARARGWEVPR